MTPDLAELAQLYGIHTSYINANKQTQQADPEGVLRVLEAFGAPADIDRALRQRREELTAREVEPVIVAWDGEFGRERLPLGYHDLTINGRETFVIAAPRKAYFPTLQNDGKTSRLWGLFAPVYALHSERNPNVGDLTDFGSLLDLVYELGGSVAATLPLLAEFLDKPFEPSPYAPASRLFWNELYIDVTRVPEYVPGQGDDPPPQSALIDYSAEMAFKRHVLERMADRFLKEAGSERRRSFEGFLKTHEGLEDYARFRAITDKQQCGWPVWPERLRQGRVTGDDYDVRAKNYHLYVQWLIQEQLAALSYKAASRGQLLYLDLPLGVHPDSYDVWHDRQFFVLGVSGGAPPDIMFTKGQNWGFPPLHPEAMRLNKHRYTIAYIRNHLRFARLLRVDHVMGLHRLYWIPQGVEGDKGVYVTYPAEEIYAILCLESHRYGAGIIGENLGIVPDYVNASLAEHNIHQMYIVQYEAMSEGQEDPLPPAPANSVAGVNTHDMPPFLAFIEGSDIPDRVDLKFIDAEVADLERQNRERIRQRLVRFLQTKRLLPEKSDISSQEIFCAVSKYLAESPAGIVLLNVEDLWQEVLPQNIPATHRERPNWLRRVRPSMEEMRRMPEVIKVLTDVFAGRS